MFEIWQNPDTKVAGMFGGLRQEEREAFLGAGLKQVRTFDTQNKDEAQKMFIEWCQKQSPGAKVEKADLRNKAEELLLPK